MADHLEGHLVREGFTDESCLLDSLRKDFALPYDQAVAGGVEHHGRSHSSFRSYTNHHMNSGSNHFVTEEDDEVDPSNVEQDCDTCLDRREQQSLLRTSTRALPRKAA